MEFTLKRNLIHHREGHMTDDEHQGSVCEEQFAHRDELHAHEPIHRAEKPHRCHICDSGFSLLPSLKRHVVCVHTKEFPHKCPHCGRDSTPQRARISCQKTTRVAHEAPNNLQKKAVPVWFFNLSTFLTLSVIRSI
ncbi:hypothetical protein CEXT_33791 [Caerostris extrusa]|uniref:C2H2-type domain-containing protein n=1 Tax=Caerostris extrusa TaxID=172846 RepID=A0AAV4UCJ2_CAEEX|nr:hypothetical protein CEXT_33791 [Caerostris extrusa]